MAETTVWEQDGYGHADVLRQTRRPVPEPKADEVVVRVHAVSVNSGDVRVMHGDPALIRLFFGLRRPRTRVRGMDVAGVVTAIGPDVTTAAVGDRIVVEAPGGGFAESVVVPSARVVRLPDTVSFADAAALPVAAGTALLALDRTEVTSGTRTLVLGASGGVGSFAVQLAAARGAEVTAVVRAETRDLAARWGATTVHERGTETAALGGPFDAIIDVTGTAPLRELQAALAPGGRAALVSGSGNPVLGPIPRIAAAAFRSRRAARLVPITATADVERLGRLITMVAAGEIRPHVSAVYPFADLAAAVAQVDEGRAVGKVLVEVVSEAG